MAGENHVRGYARRKAVAGMYDILKANAWPALFWFLLILCGNRRF
jgi:hypothetical protein